MRNKCDSCSTINLTDMFLHPLPQLRNLLQLDDYLVEAGSDQGHRRKTRGHGHKHTSLHTLLLN